MSTPGEKADLKRNAKRAATVAAPAAQTSAASAGAPTKTEFDKTVVDITALRTTLNTLITNLKSAGLVK
jgi:hypothetical protein